MARTPEQFFEENKNWFHLAPGTIYNYVKKGQFIQALKDYHAQFVPTDEEIEKKICEFKDRQGLNAVINFEKGLLWCCNFVREEPKKERRGRFAIPDLKNRIVHWIDDPCGNFVMNESGEIHEVKSPI